MFRFLIYNNRLFAISDSILKIKYFPHIPIRGKKYLAVTMEKKQVHSECEKKTVAFLITNGLS